MKTLPLEAERRAAPRRQVSEQVHLCFEDQKRVEIAGEITDSSVTGFRVRYAAAALSPGLEVSFRCTGASGKARVIWTRVLGGQNVSGFVLLSPR